MVRRESLHYRTLLDAFLPFHPCIARRPAASIIRGLRAVDTGTPNCR